MPATPRALVLTAIFLLLISIGLSGCAPAVIGVGTAAVAASTTEKACPHQLQIPKFTPS